MRGETITLLRNGEEPTGEDTQGNPIFPVDEIAVDGCAFAPGSSSDTATGYGSRTLTGGTVYAPSGTDIRPSDRFIIRGEHYVVDGEAGQWTSPFNNRGRGVEVAVKRGA